MYKGLVESRNEGRAWDLLAIWTSIRRALLTAVSTMLHWTSLKETKTSHVCETRMPPAAAKLKYGKKNI